MSNKSPALTTPVKLVMVTVWLHLPHQTFASSILLLSAGMAAHSLAAAIENSGIDSTVMAFGSLVREVPCQPESAAHIWQVQRSCLFFGFLPLRGGL